jgi:hypothetical protein
MLWFHFINTSKKVIWVNLANYDIAFEPDGTAKLWAYSSRGNDSYGLSKEDAARLDKLLIQHGVTW